MKKGTCSFRNTMSSIRICHELKLFVVFNQFIEQHLGILVMHIIITRSMNIQQVPFEVFRISGC